MEIEALADAWYVWVGVALASVAVAGIVLTLPAQPPPDADRAANAIDSAATGSYGTSASYEHDADEFRIGTRQVSLRNGGGTDHASVAFGPLAPVDAADGETRAALEALLAGVSPRQVTAKHRKFRNESDLRDAVQDLRRELDRDGPTWQPTDGKLRVRSVRIDGEVVVLVAA